MTRDLEGAVPRLSELQAVGAVRNDEVDPRVDELGSLGGPRRSPERRRKPPPRARRSRAASRSPRTRSTRPSRLRGTPAPGPVAEAGVVVPRDDPDRQRRHVGRAERHLVAAVRRSAPCPRARYSELGNGAPLWRNTKSCGTLGTSRASLATSCSRESRLQHGRAPVSRDRAARLPVVAKRVEAGDHADGERRGHDAAERHLAASVRALQAEPGDAAVVGERLAVVAA